MKLSGCWKSRRDGCTGKVGQHLLGPGERALGVDELIRLPERPEIGLEGSRVGEMLMIAKELQAIGGMRAAPSKRDRVLLEVAYAGGLRVSELVAITWADVLPRDESARAALNQRQGRGKSVMKRVADAFCSP